MTLLGIPLWLLIRPSHLLLVGLLLGCLTNRWRAGRWLLLGSSACLLVIAFTPVSTWIAAPLENRFPIPNVQQPVDGIIVLAGSEEPSLYADFGIPHFNDYADRLTQFLVLANRHPDAKLFHSGRGRTSEDVGETQSSTARTFLVGAGISPERITFEGGSRNTYESAVELAKLISPEPTETWLLITSAMHMPRSIACFQAQGIQLTPYPVGFTARRRTFAMSFVGLNNLRRLDYAAHEWLGLFYYRLEGRINTLWP